MSDIEPIATPIEPVVVAVEPIATPIEPVVVAVEPIVVAVEPIVVAVEPIATPIEPIVVAVEPIATPIEPIVTPIEPVVVAVDPIATPIEPVVVAPFSSNDSLISIMYQRFPYMNKFSAGEKIRMCDVFIVDTILADFGLAPRSIVFSNHILKYIIQSVGYERHIIKLSNAIRAIVQKVVDDKEQLPLHVVSKHLLPI